MKKPPDWSRRSALGMAIGAGALAFLSRPSLAATPLPPPTPVCDDGDEPSPAQTAGPFYTPNSPLRSDLVEGGMPGARMAVVGYVLDRACRPLAGAIVDLWHCDADGVYDNVGYRLRGHQLSDDMGRFGFSTIRPGLYPGRTRHFHVRVKAAGGGLLTTQLYFPGEPGNAADRIFDAALLMQMGEQGNGVIGRFDFILDLD